MKKWSFPLAGLIVLLPVLTACSDTSAISMAREHKSNTSSPDVQATQPTPAKPPAAVERPASDRDGQKEPPSTVPANPQPVPAESGKTEPAPAPADPGKTDPVHGPQQPASEPKPQPAQPPQPAPAEQTPPPVPTMPPADAQTVYKAGPAEVRSVALTFDDGPDAVYTGQVLDILKRQNVKATFFLIGLNAEHHPEMVKRIAAEGHAIGNHTWSHVNLPKLTAAQVQAEVGRTSDLLTEQLGYKPSLVRPPFGSLSPVVTQQMNGLGYRVIHWSVDTRDWAGTPSASIVAEVHANVKPGSIILMHSAGGKGGKLDNTVSALPKIIEDLRGQGYQFVTVPDLLNLPKSI